MRADRVFTNARLATMAPGMPGLGVVEGGVVAEAGNRIVYAGLHQEIDAPEVVDCGGRWVTPGLIDCHTHLVFAGDRAAEFEARLEGASYEEIARAGGGIMSTVRATREATAQQLWDASRPRLNALLAEGVTTVEMKSGYGLAAESELRLLKVIRRFGREWPVDVAASFLGPHALPPEFGGDRAGFLRVLIEMLPQVAAEKLADAVDGFCEGIAFSPAEISGFFEAASACGLPVKLHADQLSNLHGAALAARFGALSADHLEYTDEDGAAALAAAGTVAVILPGAFYTLRERQAPPVEAFRRHGVRMAVATDLNPGTSPLFSLLLAMNMAATQFRMTVEECLVGVTRHAAAALGRGAEVGTLEAGKKCHLAIWDIERPAELVYKIGFNPLWRRVWSGS